MGAAASTSQEPPWTEAACDELEHAGIPGDGSIGLGLRVRRKKWPRRFYCLYAFRDNDDDEVAALAGCRGSPFVLRLRHSFCANGSTYAVVDHHGADGTLFEHLRYAGAFSEARGALYAAEVAAALRHCHDRGVLYRALAPESVALDALGHCLLSSFQFATPAGRGTRSYGVPEYRCPEMVRGEPYGAEADWWALGVLVYELLAGHAPFLADARAELDAAIVRGEIRYDLGGARRLSPDARALVASLVRPDAAGRVAAGRDVGAAPLFVDLGLDASTLDARPIRDDLWLSDAASLEAVHRLARPGAGTSIAALPEDCLRHVAAFLVLGQAHLRPSLRDLEWAPLAGGDVGRFKLHRRSPLGLSPRLPP